MSKNRFYEELGAQLRSARKAAGATQSELAEALDLSRTSLTNIECGRQAISMYQLFLAAKFLGLLPSDIIPSGLPDKGDSQIPPSVEKWVGELMAN